jgi:hypothetical protein
MITPWNEIRSFYEELVAHGLPLQAMVRLIEQIEASRYARGLYAYTSMHDLCVTQVPEISTIQNSPYLRISPLSDGNIEFRYLDTHIESRQWHRVVGEDEAYQRLERFVDQLHWFGGER